MQRSGILTGEGDFLAFADFFGETCEPSCTPCKIRIIHQLNEPLNPRLELQRQERKSRHSEWSCKGRGTLHLSRNSCFRYALAVCVRCLDCRYIVVPWFVTRTHNISLAQQDREAQKHLLHRAIPVIYEHSHSAYAFAREVSPSLACTTCRHTTIL